MSITAGVTAVLGTVTKAVGQKQSASANATAQDYNAQVAQNNAAIATQEATWAGEEGVQNAGISEMKTAATEGAIQANQGASGVEVGSGSHVDVQNSTRELGMLDAMTIRSNAARQAYGYQVQSTSDIAQSNLDKYAAKNDIAAGNINVGTTILGGASSIAENNPFSSYQSNGSFIDTGNKLDSPGAGL